jgi:cytochrome c oxidase subunit IV
MVVDWAGVYFQQLVFCIFTVLSYTTGVAEFAVAGTLVDTMTLLNLNPLFQFDGYWFLVDYLGLPELHRLAWTQIRRWFLRSKEALVMPAMRRHGRRIFLVYAIGSVGCIALLLRLEYRYVLHPSATFFARLPKTLHALVTALKTGEFMKAGSHLLGILYAVIIPLSLVLGLSMYATRIYRYFTRRSTTIVRSSA